MGSRGNKIGQQFDCIDLRVLRKEHIFHFDRDRQRRFVLQRTHENFREVAGKKRFHH
jgi:hypothetical protein